MVPKIEDGPWPAFPSDLTSIAVTVATQAFGTVLMFEKMFENRLFFADKLVSMGARIILCDPHRAVVTGPAPLVGQRMESPDIRAGMAMLLAALAARGTVDDRRRAPDRQGLRAHRRAAARARRARSSASTLSGSERARAATAAATSTTPKPSSFVRTPRRTRSPEDRDDLARRQRSGSPPRPGRGRGDERRGERGAFLAEGGDRDPGAGVRERARASPSTQDGGDREPVRAEERRRILGPARVVVAGRGDDEHAPRDRVPDRRALDASTCAAPPRLRLTMRAPWSTA